MPANAGKYLLLFLSAALYAWVGYGTERVALTIFPNMESFYLFAGINMALFVIYFFLLSGRRFTFTVKEIIVAAVLLRLVLMGIMPNLSDDYFRFAWDGRLLADGNNPYLVMPETFVDTEAAEALELDGWVYEGLNSKQYYTVYPPLNQVLFAVGAWIGGESLLGNVIGMRIPIVLAEIGLILLIISLLRHFGKPIKLVAIYAFNPLIIQELTGNLHYEGVMLFFVVLAIWALVKNKKWWVAGLAFAGGILIKLLPLLYLPFFLRRLGWGRAIGFYAVVGLVCALCFLPFVNSELIENFSSSLDLYFRKFEFNASFYYVFRWIGEQASGFNLIAFIGPGMAGVVLLGTFLMMILEKKPDYEKLFLRMLFAATLYLSMATIVHPWYLASLLVFSVFTRYRFVMVWSCFAMLTYLKYTNPFYIEPYLVIVLEYTAAFGVLAYELFRRRSLFKLA